MPSGVYNHKKGICRPQATKEKISKTKKGTGRGENNSMYGVYLIGKKNGNWRGGKIEKNCLICGEKIERFPSAIKLGRGKFCSHSCKAIYWYGHQRKESTSIELKVDDMLKKLGIKYESQKVIPEGRTVADFYIPEQRLVIYADGEYWHSRPGVPRRDATQDLLLGLYGYKVLRLREDEINLQPKKCFKRISRQFLRLKEKEKKNG